MTNYKALKLNLSDFHLVSVIASLPVIVNTVVGAVLDKVCNFVAFRMT